MRQNKIGVLGGTFNPVHRGHVDLGLKIKAAFGLKKVLYVLSAQPPHKKMQRLAAAEIRLAMLKEALRPHPGLLPCDLELRRPGASWTIDTIRQLKKENPADQFFFISGSEGFLKIRTWKEYRQLFREVFFIIVIRQNSHQVRVERLLHREGIPIGHPPEYSSLPPTAFLVSYASAYLSLSATAVRNGAAQGRDISPWVEKNVQTILEENKLYED
ncbi:MAG: nicotinate (nicotinamide) nucleotide adenylyltransferase [Candidatus Aminicenantes bacterium]|nr:nicotinate (nicotinamide) nucleotide adenylyltransferase [Candidatus Aminicenantes bacterium]